ncbi:MAG: PGPGW domain-containing protein [Gammaproteobacteria bacterium]
MYKPQDSDNTRVAADRAAPQAQAAGCNNAAPEDEGLVATGLRQARRVVVLVVGGAVLLAGVVMLITPGPGLIGIAVGLGILSIEFAWARSLLRKFKQKYMHARQSFSRKKRGQSAHDRHD